MISGLTIDYVVGGGSPEGPEVLERLSVAFERAGDELADFGKHVFPVLAPVFEAEMERQFDAQGDGPSGPWAQLSPGYEAWKAKHYPGNPILEATGRMKDGLTDSSSPFATRRFGDSTFDFGTHGVEYASFHQTGTALMPVRPVFDFSSDFERDLAAAALAGAREAVRVSGLAEFVEGP